LVGTDAPQSHLGFCQAQKAHPHFAELEIDELFDELEPLIQLTEEEKMAMADKWTDPTFFDRPGFRFLPAAISLIGHSNLLFFRVAQCVPDPVGPSTGVCSAISRVNSVMSLWSCRIWNCRFKETMMLITSQQ
jgi:hypothetical protein